MENVARKSTTEDSMEDWIVIFCNHGNETVVLALTVAQSLAQAFFNLLWCESSSLI